MAGPGQLASPARTRQGSRPGPGWGCAPQARAKGFHPLDFTPPTPKPLTPLPGLTPSRWLRNHKHRQPARRHSACCFVRSPTHPPMLDPLPSPRGSAPSSSLRSPVCPRRGPALLDKPRHLRSQPRILAPEPAQVLRVLLRHLHKLFQPVIHPLYYRPRNFRCATVRDFVATRYRSASAASSPPTPSSSASTFSTSSGRFGSCWRLGSVSTRRPHRR